MTGIPRTTLPRTTLTGDGVILRQFADSDAADVVAACNDGQTARYLPMLPQPYAIDDAMFYLRTVVENNWATGGAAFAIADPATGRLLGSVGGGKPRSGGHATSVGYWVAPWARGRGVATAATRALVSWLFENGYGRIELTTDLANEASQRVALNSGFRHEGIRRSASAYRDGNWADMVVWTRLNTDSGEPTERLLPDLPGGKLSDGVVTLTRLTPTDGDDLYALQSLPEVVATTVRPDPPTLQSARDRCAQAAYPWLLGTRAEFSIRDAGTGAFAGDIGLFHEPLTAQAMIGYSVARAWRGRGYASRAARLVSDWAFDHCRIARVVAGAAADNAASQQVLLKAGFQREGYERSRLPGPGGLGRGGESRIDNVAFAKLPTDRPL